MTCTHHKKCGDCFSPSVVADYAAEIERLTAELVEARKDRDTWRDACEYERRLVQDAHEGRVVAERERDARPAITREQAALMCSGVVAASKLPDLERVWEALRAHASGAKQTSPTASHMDASDAVELGVVLPSREDSEGLRAEAWDEAVEACAEAVLAAHPRVTEHADSGPIACIDRRWTAHLLRQRLIGRAPKKEKR